MISVCRPYYRDASTYEKLLEQTWNEHIGFFAKFVTFVSDIGFSPKKAERLRSLRTRLRERVGATERSEVVFIRRGRDDRLRNPHNEDQLVTKFEGLGAKVVDGDKPISEVLQQVLDADIIIGMEGSQLAHAALLLRDGGALVVMQSPFRFYNPHYEWTRLMDMHYGTVVGTVTEDGFVMNTDEVVRLIENVANDLRESRVI